jgi:hypothetical protein
LDFVGNAKTVLIASAKILQIERNNMKNSTEFYKTAAYRASEFLLKKRNLKMKHSEALELIAAVFNQPNWQTLNAIGQNEIENPLLISESPNFLTSSIDLPVNNQNVQISEVVVDNEEEELRKKFKKLEEDLEKAVAASPRLQEFQKHIDYLESSGILQKSRDERAVLMNKLNQVVADSKIEKDKQKKVAFEKASDEEIASVVENCNVKVFMKLEDPKFSVNKNEALGLPYDSGLTTKEISEKMGHKHTFLKNKD